MWHSGFFTSSDDFLNKKGNNAVKVYQYFLILCSCLRKKVVIFIIIFFLFYEWKRSSSSASFSIGKTCGPWSQQASQAFLGCFPSTQALKTFRFHDCTYDCMITLRTDYYNIWNNISLCTVDSWRSHRTCRRRWRAGASSRWWRRYDIEIDESSCRRVRWW